MPIVGRSALLEEVGESAAGVALGVVELDGGEGGEVGLTGACVGLRGNVLMGMIKR